MAPRVLAQHDRVRLEADLGGVHDLVGAPLLEDAVLVDPRLVREGIAPHHRLVRLDRITGEPRHHPARPGELPGVDGGVESVHVATGAEQHHDLLQRAVAGSLADPVHRALDLARAGEDTGIGVRDREAEVIVAMDRGANIA